jgi:hypothetical protein
MELKSKAFCSASWTDINIDLSRKQIQHCCKAEFEKYTKLSHNFINNSAGIVQRREESLKGINNEQCNSCWKNYAENNSAYREIKHKDTFVVPKNANDAISYIEIKFDNVCNLSCLYCDQNYSSTIAKEKNLKNIYKKYKDEDLDVLLEFLNNLLQNKKIFQINILGGEPTLSQGYHKLVKTLLDNHADKNIIFITTTNGIIHPNVLQTLSSYVKTKSNWQWVWGFSGESTGKLFESIRFGSDHNIWQNNVTFFDGFDNCEIVFDPTVNLLSISDLLHYLTQINNLSNRYLIKGNWVLEPNVLSITKASKKHISMLHKCKTQILDSKCVNKQEALNWIDQIEKMLETSACDVKELEKFLKQKNKEKGNALDVDYIINTL